MGQQYQRRLRTYQKGGLSGPAGPNLHFNKTPSDFGPFTFEEGPCTLGPPAASENRGEGLDDFQDSEVTAGTDFQRQSLLTSSIVSREQQDSVRDAPVPHSLKQQRCW